MKKNKQFILLLGMLVLCISCAEADVCKFKPGLITCGVGVVQEIKGNGLVELNGTTVVDGVTVNGRLVANNASLNEVNVNGSFSLDKTKITGLSTINGSLNATDSNIAQTMELGSSESTLSGTTSADIIVTAMKPAVQQTLNLENSTKVLGSITFKQGNGLVYLFKTSSITGQVNDGKIINK